MTKLIVLGIDPGLSSTGYAIAEVDTRSRAIRKVREIGVSKTKRSTHRTIRKTSDDLARAQEQARLLRGLLERHEVDVISCEMASTTPYTLPTFSFGVMMGIIAALDRPVVELLPFEVKQAATGDRNATKAAMIRWAVDLTSPQNLDWPTSNKRDHVGVEYRGRSVTLAAEHPADALATIHAAIASEQFRLACTMAIGSKHA